MAAKSKSAQKKKSTPSVKVKNKVSNKSGRHKHNAKAKAVLRASKAGKAPIQDGKGTKMKTKPFGDTSKKGKRKAPAQSENPVPVEEEESDVEVAEEDLEFVDTNPQYAAFLSNMDTNSLKEPAHKKRKKLPADQAAMEKAKAKGEESDAEDYEAQPRTQKKNWNKTESSDKLPIKTEDGKIIDASKAGEEARGPKAWLNKSTEDAESQGTDEEEQSGDEDAEGSSEEDADSADEVAFESEEDLDELESIQSEESSKAPQAPADLAAGKTFLVERKKVQMAKLCESIMEDPDRALKRRRDSPRQMSELQELHELCLDEDVIIRKYALLSELTIFQDILPGYRIRLPTEKELEQKVSKDVQKVRDFERGLLNHYQSYLKHLELTARGDPNVEQEQLLDVDQIRKHSEAVTAVRCMCELLRSHWHFNFRSNLINALIPRGQSKSKEITVLVHAAISRLFREDTAGEVTLEAVKNIVQFAKKRDFRLAAGLLDTLINIPLKVDMARGQEAKQNIKQKRKLRKKERKEGDDILAGLDEASATVDKDEVASRQSDTLQEVVLLYFRILRKTKNSPLLPSVLRGLSKFAHLVNLDVMVSLLDALKELLNDPSLPLESALRCIMTALNTLRGPGQELKVDEKEYINGLYRILAHIADANNAVHVPLALQCVEAIFCQRKEYMAERVAAFIKRLMLVAVLAPPPEAIKILQLVKTLFSRYPKTQQILDGEQDRAASGVYRPDLEDPEHANPYAASAWEFSILHHHWHPEVRRQVKKVFDFSS